jgi:ribokinase
MDILAVGSVCFDFIAAVDERLREDESTVSLRTLVRSHGGRAANFAVFARTLRKDVRLVSLVGADFPGSTYEAELMERKVDLTGLLLDKSAETQHVFVFRGADQARIYVYRDRRKDTEAAYSAWVEQTIETSDARGIYCTSEIPEVNFAALHASRSALRVFSPGPDVHRYDKACLEECLTAANVACLSSSECQIMEDILGGSVSPPARGLDILAVTHGSRGSVVYSGRDEIHIAAVSAQRVVDTTGAGDAYAAGFVAEMLAGADVIKAARMASTVASFAIEHNGCQTFLPSREEVVSRCALSYQ